MGNIPTSVARFDRADALLNAHPALQIRMETIEDERDLAARAMNRAYERFEEARTAKRQAEDNRREVQAHFDNGTLITEKHLGFDEKTGMQIVEQAMDDDAVRKAELAVESAKARFLRADETRATASEAWQAASRLHAACERYLGQIGKFVPAPAKGAPHRGETPAAAVDRLRAEIDRIAALISKAERAPKPAEEIRRLIRREVQLTAKRGAPLVGKNGVRWPPMLVGVNSITDCLALIARMFPEQLAAVAEAEVKDSPDAMSDEQRERRLNELASQHLALNREEEAVIRVAEQAGAKIARRAEADPRAVLDVDGPSPRD